MGNLQFNGQPWPPPLAIAPPTPAPSVSPWPSAAPSATPSFEPSSIPTSSFTPFPTTSEDGLPGFLDTIGFRILVEPSCNVTEVDSVQDYLDNVLQATAVSSFAGRNLQFTGFCSWVCSSYPKGTCYRLHRNCANFRRTRQLAAAATTTTTTTKTEGAIRQKPMKGLSRSRYRKLNTGLGGLFGDAPFDDDATNTALIEFLSSNACSTYNLFALEIISVMIPTLGLSDGCGMSLLDATIDCFEQPDE